MDIVAHVFLHVNAESSQNGPDRSIDSQKWEAKKKEARIVAAKMRRAGLAFRAVRMEHCADHISGTYCRECGRVHITRAELCRDRLCPVCSWRLSLKRYAMMVQIMETLGDRFPAASWTFCTLTVKNCLPVDLGRVLDEMSDAWNRVMNRKSVKQRVIGYARSVELTYNSITGEVHPHYHVLLMWAGDADKDLVPQAWIDSVRLHVSPLAQNEQIIDRSASEEAVLETYKYAIKPGSLDNMPVQTFRVVADIMRGRRLVSFGGLVKSVAAALGDPDDPETLDNDTTDAACIHCSSPAVAHVAAIWAGTEYVWRTRGY